MGFDDRRIVVPGGSGAVQAWKIPYLGDRLALEDPSSIAPTIEDRGNGVTRITIPSASSGSYGTVNLGAAYIFEALDVDGDAMTGQHVDYYIRGGIRVDKVLAQHVQVGMYLFEPEAGPVFSGTVEGFGAALYGVDGSTNGPISHAQRLGWQEGTAPTVTKGDASTRVVDWCANPYMTTAIQGYFGPTTISRAAWSAGSDTPQRLAQYQIYSTGDAADSFTRLAVVVTTRAALGADFTFDAEFWFEAHKRSKSLRDAGFGA